MTTSLTLISLILIIILAECTNNAGKTENINFEDTLYKTKILEISNGDTVREHDTIYFKSTDLTIDTTKFHYGVSARSSSNIYNIFFPRNKVVLFCDSMLNALPPYDNQDLVLFNERLPYTHIKEQASNDKMDEAIYVDELPILLERFHPFIIDFKTNDKPKYIIIAHEDTKYAEYKTFSSKSKIADTVFLASVCLRPQEMQLEK
jgi:hypothetical protein